MATYGTSTTTTGISTSTASKNTSNGLLAELMGGQPAPARLKIPQKDLLMFFRQLAVILQSGVPLAQGMILIAENMSNDKLSSCIQRISARLSAGEELSLSLRQYPKVFEPLTIGLIEAGEAGGILEEVLDRIALLLEERAKIRGQIIGALTYPVIVLFLAVTVSLALLIFIVPRFKGMFDGMGATLPPSPTFCLSSPKLLPLPTSLRRTFVDNRCNLSLPRLLQQRKRRIIVDRNILKFHSLVISY